MQRKKVTPKILAALTVVLLLILALPGLAFATSDSISQTVFNAASPGTYWTFGQSFTVDTYEKIDNVVLKLNAEEAVVDKSVIVAIHSMPIGPSSLLGTSAPQVLLATGFADYTFAFATPVAVTPGQYALIAYSPTSEGFNFNYNNVNIYDDGTRLNWNGASWDTVTDDLYFIVNMTIDTYTITFDSAGGSAVASITQDYGTAVTAPASPTREGYTFAGWNPAVPATMPVGGAALTAQWTINAYTITDSAGGSAVASITQNYGTAVTAPANPTREGYTFAGWNPAVPATMPVGGAALTAQWTINAYTITFDSAGGSAVASITQNFGTAVTAPANPTRTGYAFAGWSPAVPATMPVGGAALTAQWTINNYTVTFKNWDNSVLSTQTIPYGGSATPPAVPARTGYTFTGWDQSTTNITGDVIALALFVPDTGENDLDTVPLGIALLLAAAALILLRKRDGYYYRV